MAKRGQATLAGRLDCTIAGSSMPVDAPYFASPPAVYRDGQVLTIAYETDDEAAAEMLPLGLTLPTPARAFVMIAHYPHSSYGPYNEAILALNCEWEGQARYYYPHLVTDSVPPLVAGRELWGFPKKIAQIQLDKDAELVRATVERPQGVRIVTAAMRPDRLVSVPPDRPEAVSLRVIPSVEPGEPPALAELVETPSIDRTTHEAWIGPATLSFEAQSELDPWHRLPVRKMVNGSFARVDFALPHGRVLRTY